MWYLKLPTRRKFNLHRNNKRSYDYFVCKKCRPIACGYKGKARVNKMEENVTINPWVCKECNTHNLEQDDVCRKCGTEIFKK